MAIPYRKEKLAAQIVKEVSDIIFKQIKDPRLGFTTVTRAEVSPDYKYAKVFVSILGDDRKKKLSLEALKHAEGFFQRELGRRLKLRSAPELTFVRDDSIDKTFKMIGLINKLARERKPGTDEESAGKEEE
jgi:ribosome-binding factor A